MFLFVLEQVLTDSIERFLEVSKVDVGGEIRFARIVKHVHNLVVAEGLGKNAQIRKKSVRVAHRRMIKLTLNELANDFSSP